MNLIIKIAAALTLVYMAGCSQQQDDKTEKPADTGVLKTQMETLEQAKQVGQVIQQGDEFQRQQIEKEVQ
jgi:hypothetical protein